MKRSRGWAVLYLLLVVGGGAVMVGAVVFDPTISVGDYDVPLWLTVALAAHFGGLFRLVSIVDGRRIQVLGAFGIVVGFVLTFVAYYAGVGLLISIGVGLFVVVFDANPQLTAKSA